jgi:hypothetical protein
MRAALAFALRPASARLVLVIGAGGLVYVVYRALRHFHHWWTLAPFGSGRPSVVLSSPWDLAVASLVAVVALMVAAALYRRPSINR